MTPRLFGSSGIRGVVGKDITAEFAIKLGASIGTWMGGSGEVALGYDTRVSSLPLSLALSSGLMAAGLNVHKMGLVPTPALAYLTKKHEFDLGIMVTASHNPPEYNGFKLFNKEGVSYAPEDVEDLEDIILEQKFSLVKWDRVGASLEDDLLLEYHEMLLSVHNFSRKLKVVVDVGNGATYKTTPFVLSRLGLEVKTVNAQPDGNFPGRPPEPSEENLSMLMETVRLVGADVGIAHDGDGDRIAVVDDKGRYVPQDVLLALYAKLLLKEQGGGTVVINVDSSSVVDKVVEELGGRVVRTKVGDVYIAKEVTRHGALFGGETSGAWIHPKYNMCPDGPLSAVLLLRYLDLLEVPLSQLVDGIPRYTMLRAKVRCPNHLKRKALERIDEKVKSSDMPVDNVLTIDGYRYELEDKSWVLIRPSGTEPLIRITVESKDESQAKSILDRCRRMVEEAVGEVA